MSHEMETMFYYKEVPWHGLGTKVDRALTAEEAIVAAGLNWEVELRDVFTHTGEGNMVLVPDKKAIARKTDDLVYAVLGKSYRPIQNHQAFGFFDDVVKTGMVNYETAGSLQSGSKIWILAKMKSPLEVKGEPIERYITLVNSHDGSAALQMFWTPIRVVCMNTLRMAQGARIGETFYARHTSGATNKVDTAMEVLGLANSYYATWLEEANRLASKVLTDEEATKIVMAAFGQDGNQPVPTHTAGEIGKVMNLRFNGVGQDNTKVQGTAWQVYNAVVEYADYYKVPRSKVESARLSSVWFGSGNIIKERAWNAALSLS